MYHLVKKKPYLIADSTRSSALRSVPEIVLANSACTFSTCRTPAAWRSLPSAVTTALTARRSSGSSTRRTSPSASRRSTSCVTFERTQVIFMAHSLKLSGSPSLTRCERAPNFANESPTCSKASSRRDSSTCAALTSEYIIGPSPVPGLTERSLAGLFIYEYYSADASLVKPGGLSLDQLRQSAPRPDPAGWR